MGCCISSLGIDPGKQDPCPATFLPHDLVQIHSLETDSSLNGQQGVLLRWLPNSQTARDDGGRFETLVQGRIVALKPVNLRHKLVCLHDKVRLHGLSTKVGMGMNGRLGFVKSWLPNDQTARDDGGRWVVSLEGPGSVGESDGDVDEVALLPKMLVAVEGGKLQPSTVNATAVNATAAGDDKPVPLLSSTATDPYRTDAQPLAGVDAALGSKFNTCGKSNKGNGIPVATAVAP